VCVADIDGAAVEKVADDIRKGGAAALHYCVDIGEEEQVRAMVAATVEAFGGVDVLQNTVAATGEEYFRRDGLMAEMETEVWDFAMRITLRGTMLCCKRVTGQCIPVDGGQIMHSPMFADLNRLSHGRP
jgi:NAD(P)-dependent dehydrogenase (short-subunit alcohol dehydrogenase family)